MKLPSWMHKMRPATRSDIETATEKILMKTSEVAAALAAVDDKLDAVGVQLNKAQAEIVKQIADLKASLGDADLPPEAQAAFDRLIASANALTPVAQALDDITPD